MASITHSKVATLPDDPSVEVNKSEWNAGHIIRYTPTTIAYAATIAPASAGDVTYRVILTGPLTLNLPTSGADGDRVKLWLTASGADRVLTLNASYKIPSSSILVSPVTITSGKKAKLLLEYDATLNGGQWEVTSFINGY